MSGLSADLIDRTLRAAIEPLQHLEVINESDQHHGHAGYTDGQTHFRVKIVSPRMDGLPRVARHRLVYDALRDVIPMGVHALAIEARSPAEAAAPR
jgi:BolA family transcriptional regulator, general stress-responsive regulator